MTKELTIQDYCEAARTLGCDVAALMAVAEVESSGSGYDEFGRIKLRFEGHKFREYTFGKYDKTHPHLSYPYKNQKFKQHGYNAFNEAFALDQEAALKASSFGKFQPLAVNHREAGFTNVRAFVDFLRKSERNQLIVFCLMVKFRHLDDELRGLKWAAFAENYNGKSYRDNDYDGRMSRAYKKYKAQKIDCNRFADLRDDEIHLDIPTTSSAAGNVSRNSAAIPVPMPDADDAGETNGSGASGGAASTQTTIKTDTVDITASAPANRKPAASFDAFIPQIDTAKSYLKKLFSGSALATAGAMMLGLPQWIQISLAALVLIVVIGGIVIFVRYYKDIFAFATAMNTLRATQGVDNPILTTEQKD